MDLTLTPAWSIELASAHPAARLAADELRAHLAALGAPELPLTSAAAGPRIALRHGAAGEGFVRAPDAGGLLLEGAGPAGLLYAAYDLLERLGCAWPAPGPAVAPRRERVELPAELRADRPALARRGLILGHDSALARAEEWVVWAARNRLNTLFVHTTIAAPALGACRLGSWRSRRRTLLLLVRERAMALELGGHHLRDLLPRRLFGLDPELFRHDGRRRTPDHNFCVSSPRALGWAAESAAAFYAAYPEAEVYHLWPDDLRAGGWCRCAACARLTPADQALIATNALAAALPAGRPAARVAYLAYHDTEAPPELVQPHAAVTPLFAPRLRSYAAGVGAPANAPVLERVARCAARFSAPPAVFEYYLDGILFKSSPPPLAATIAADMPAYAAAGVAAAHVLLTGERPFLQAPPNAFLFARMAWAPQSDPAALRAAYGAARAPRAAEALARAYAELEAAWRPALARDPAAESEEGQLRRRDPVAHPPADVLDTFGEPRRAAEQRLEAMAAVEPALARGREAWAAVFAAERGAAQGLVAEQAEWELGAALLRFLALRHQLYVLLGRAAPRARIVEALGEAQSALDALMAWAERNLPAGARAEHRLLRAPFQLQLDHVADRALLSPAARLGLRARRARDLAMLLPRLLR